MKAKITLDELDKLNVYRCQCCKPVGKFLFEMPADGLCPDHGYPLHYVGPLPVIYRSLGTPTDTLHSFKSQKATG